MIESLVQRFNGTLGAAYDTRLEGGAAEPFYRAGPPAILYFREDYVRSALHEIAHWCIAGPERRKRDDYGYWYSADGRDPLAQAAFEQAEIKPQALERLFCEALGIDFSVSADNLSYPVDTRDFSARVEQQACLWQQNTHDLPPRGALWLRELNDF